MMRYEVTDGGLVSIMKIMICLGILMMLPGRVWAGLVELPDMGYKINAPLVDNLQALTGKKINLTLNSGSTFTGIVKAVGKDLVHLEKLEGKDYFDALILIEDISAIDARFRDYQR